MPRVAASGRVVADATIPSVRLDWGTRWSSSDGVSLTYMIDRSGNGFTASNIAPGIPAFTQGAAYAQFDGSANAILTTKSPPFATRAVDLHASVADFTVFAVISPDAQVNNPASLLNYENTGNTQNFEITAALTSYTLSFTDGAAARQTSNAVVVPNSAPAVLEFVRSGTSLTGVLNGTANTPAVVTSTLTSAANTVRLGRYSSSTRFWKGKFYRLIVCNAALTSPERSEVRAYLGRFYGIAVT